MSDVTIAINNLDSGHRKSALENPVVWDKFAVEMKGCVYGVEELTDAWFYFLQGWRAHEHFTTHLG
jgi:hypothetical protein